MICQQMIMITPELDTTGTACTIVTGDFPRYARQAHPLAMLRINRQVHDEFLGTLLSHSILPDLRGHILAKSTLVAVVSAGPGRKFLDYLFFLRFGERYRTPFGIGITIHSLCRELDGEIDDISMIELVKFTLDELCTEHDDFMFWEFLMATDRIMILEFAI